MSHVRDMAPINEPTTINLAKLLPNMSEDKRKKLSNASNWDWHDARDFNEGDVFERKFREICGYYYAQGVARDSLGASILKLFQKYKPAMEAFVKEFTYSTEKVNGEFMGDIARGASETTIRPLVLDSFSDVAYTAPSCANYWQLPGAVPAYPVPGEQHIIPDNIQTAAGRAEAVAHENRRAFFIVGYAELVAGVAVYDSVQEDVNDSIGLRNPLYHWPQMSMTNLLLMQNGTPLYVETGEEYDLDGWATAEVVSGLWPIGIECIIEPELGAVLGWP